MATIQGGKLVPIPFQEMIHPETGRVRVRYVNLESEAYRTKLAHMIRLEPEDLDEPDRLGALAKAGKMTEEQFADRFGYLVRGRGKG
jgi:6-phosphofructokinase 1